MGALGTEDQKSIIPTTWVISIQRIVDFGPPVPSKSVKRCTNKFIKLLQTLKLKTISLGGRLEAQFDALHCCSSLGRGRNGESRPLAYGNYHIYMIVSPGSSRDKGIHRRWRDNQLDKHPRTVVQWNLAN
jgi:hypothetical protein